LRNLEGRRVSLGESSEGQNFSFPALVMPEYDFDEEETSVGQEEAPLHPPRDCSTARNTSAGHGGSHSSTWCASVPDGLRAERQRRRYTYSQNWNNSLISFKKSRLSH
jgi:hypothetical protein